MAEATIAEIAVGPFFCSAALRAIDQLAAGPTLPCAQANAALDVDVL